MSVNLSRLLTIIAFAVGILAIYSVNVSANEISSIAFKEMDSGTYFFEGIQNFVSDILSGSMNDVLATLGTAVAGVSTGVVAVVKLA